MLITCQVFSELCEYKCLSPCTHRGHSLEVEMAKPHACMCVLWCLYVRLHVYLCMCVYVCGQQKETGCEGVNGEVKQRDRVRYVYHRECLSAIVMRPQWNELVNSVNISGKKMLGLLIGYGFSVCVLKAVTLKWNHQEDGIGRWTLEVMGHRYETLMSRVAVLIEEAPAFLSAMWGQ